MQKLSREHKHQVVQIWKAACQSIMESFGLAPPEIPPEIRIEAMNKPAPGMINDCSLIINSSVPNYEDVLSATISKLCLQQALPADVLCKECIDDLSFEFARRSIRDTKTKKKWESIWSNYSPSRKVSQLVEYNPRAGYIWLQSVAGDRGLNIFIQELAHRGKNHLPLSFEDYMQYFSARVRRFKNSLDATELKLVKTITNAPNLSAKEISDSVGISEEWVSRKLSQLQKQMILRKFLRAPFSHIGIQMFQVLVSRREPDDDPFNLFKECPFLYSYRKVVSGKWNALATLTIPENKDSIRFIERGLKHIVALGFDIDLHQIHSAGSSYNFDYYEQKNGQWNNPWELLAIHLQRIQSDNLAASIPRVDTPSQRTEIELDELDMKVIQCIGRGIGSVSKIRSYLQVGQQRVTESMQKLRENGLIRKSWEVHNIGLNEHAIIYCKYKKIGETIAAWSLRLPRSIVTFSSKNELLLLADLPTGGCYGLASALDGLNDGACMGILSPQTYGSWGFPVPLWDFTYQRWKCPKKRLETWISQLD